VPTNLTSEEEAQRVDHIERLTNLRERVRRAEDANDAAGRAYMLAELYAETDRALDFVRSIERRAGDRSRLSDTALAALVRLRRIPHSIAHTRTTNNEPNGDQSP
jgi:hypothetical protein